MKAVLAVVGGALLSVLAGCATELYKSGEQQTTASDREERCMVTGSNLPKRDCLKDVTLLPPSSAERTLSTQPAAAPGAR